jgi:colicin import membrane protein
VRDAEIALEKAREEKRQQQEQARREAERREQERRQAEERAAREREQQARREAERREQERRQAKERAAREREQQARREAERREQERRQAEERRRAEERQQAEDQKLREAFRSTATAAAGIETGRADGTALRNQAAGAGGSDAYAAAVRSCVKPGVVYAPGPADTGNPVAEFRVQLLPTGEQAGPPRLVKSSGNPAFDRAVENGIRRCDPFPRPPSGRFDSSIIIPYAMFDR